MYSGSQSQRTFWQSCFLDKKTFRFLGGQMQTRRYKLGKHTKNHYITSNGANQRGQFILFSVVHSPSPPPPPATTAVFGSYKQGCE
jgi:hypothetical protein